MLRKEKKKRLNLYIVGGHADEYTRMTAAAGRG
jgi:hypothetical protein